MGAILEVVRPVEEKVADGNGPPVSQSRWCTSEPDLPPGCSGYTSSGWTCTTSDTLLHSGKVSSCGVGEVAGLVVRPVLGENRALSALVP